jgi:AcrR family transcriptional regulator
MKMAGIIRKLNRREKGELTRGSLCRAAAELIAEKGFAETTIVRITERAGVALGTFYNYFENRDILFAQLVSDFGRQLRSFVAQAVPAGSDFFEREEAAFRAWFRFLRDNPFFVRVLNEAEIFSPESFEEYFEAVTAGYRRVLADAVRKKEIDHFDSASIEVAALMLMSSRTYFGLRLFHKVDSSGEMDPKIVATYMRLVRGALCGAASRLNSSTKRATAR